MDARIGPQPTDIIHRGTATGGRPYNGLGNGRVIAALGADVARKGPAVRHAVTEGLRPFIELLTRTVHGRSRVVRRRRSCAIQTNTSGCGGITVSEVFFKKDRSLSYAFDS